MHAVSFFIFFNIDNLHLVSWFFQMKSITCTRMISVITNLQRLHFANKVFLCESSVHPKTLGILKFELKLECTITLSFPPSVSL